MQIKLKMAKKDAKCFSVSLMPRFFIDQKCPSLVMTYTYVHSNEKKEKYKR